MNIPKLIVLCAAMMASPLSAEPGDYAPDSLYRLEVDLHGHQGAQGSLDLNAGAYTLVTMFYGSCPHVCPMIISTMQEA
jgi:cytochrome oxidase Cu insertion factor (SCO1/SenC/PrrC family)